MASGWAPDGAVQEQIDDTVSDAVRRARGRIPVGEGAACCDECGEAIPEGRRRAVPGVRTCVACQDGRDQAPAGGGTDRRGGKGSRMR